MVKRVSDSWWKDAKQKITSMWQPKFRNPAQSIRAKGACRAAPKAIFIIFFFWLIYFFWNFFPSRLRRGGGGPEKIHQLRISRFHYGLESLRLSNGPSQHSTHTHTDGWAKTFTPSFARLGNLKDLEMMMKMDGGDGGSCRRRWRDIQLAPATGPRTDWTGLTNLVVTVEGEQQRGRFIIQSAPSSMSRAGMAPLSFFLLFSWRNVP